MKLTNKQKLSKTIRWLRKEFPGPVSVYTKQVKLPIVGKMQILGDTERKAACFIIRLHKPSEYRVKMDTILHEWAHVLTWFDCKYEDHPNVWGEKYAGIYRSWLKWNIGRKEK